MQRKILINIHTVCVVPFISHVNLFYRNVIEML